jgi:hypothetical protein
MNWFWNKTEGNIIYLLKFFILHLLDGFNGICFEQTIRTFHFPLSSLLSHKILQIVQLYKMRSFWRAVNIISITEHGCSQKTQKNSCSNTDSSVLKCIIQWAPKHYTLNNRNVHAILWIIFLPAYETVSLDSLFCSFRQEHRCLENFQLRCNILSVGFWI